MIIITFEVYFIEMAWDWRSLSQDGMGKRINVGYTQECTHGSRPLYESVTGAYEPFQEATTMRIAYLSTLTIYTK